ncbi:response regulator [Aquibacillus saliphilus]|uniref:response regulator n=1 Tax=Aquibacillus saliphilus TaxID=1909422 RepID=UPI001CF04FCF|nr:response regulator [Aquibacillus saliphilus]
MKAIIIDDEIHVREGLILLAEWENFGITTILEAADGLEAIKLIREHEPEIIFTDMNMPKCDGIELIKWIRTENINSKTIAVSGYDDFKYMKNAIMYGVFDYLLKPIHKNDLNETLMKAVEEWKKKNSLRLFNKSNDQVVWDHLLSDVLDKPKLTIPIIEDIEKEYHLDVSHEPFTVALLSIRMHRTKKDQENMGVVFSSILSICNEAISRYKKGIAFRNMNKEDEIVLLLWKLNDEHYVINQIISQIKQATNLHCTIALGQQFLQLVDAYQSARQIYDKHNLIEMNSQTILSTIPKNDQKHIKHLLDYSEEIKWAIQSGSMEQLDKVLKQIYVSSEKNEIFTMEQLELWESQFDILKKHWLKEYEINKHSDLYKGNDYWDDHGCFDFTRFQEEKRKEFNGLLEMIFQVNFKKEKNSVLLIEEYLRNNYQKDITLSDISEQFYLSREYISRKFKQQFNKTITDYVTALRIEKAKELLENPYLKVYEIASSVGYLNDKYFIKVFKKTVGITPKEFQKEYVVKRMNV